MHVVGKSNNIRREQERLMDVRVRGERGGGEESYRFNCFELKLMPKIEKKNQQSVFVLIVFACVYRYNHKTK